MNFVEELWLKYREERLPVYLGVRQYQVAREAFYAGVGSIWTFIGDNITNDGGLTEADVEKVKSVTKELEKFEADRVRPD